MKRFKSFNKVILCALIALLSGCAHQQHFNVKRGEVFTPGVKITAEDGSFTLKYGEPFKTPFHNGPYTTDSSELVYDLQNAVNDNGARLVRVTVPGLKDPLYGALMIPAIQEGAKGPATRSLGIDVPQKFVNAALGAKVSVVYEVVTLEEAGDDYPEEVGYAWILWLSDSPFVLDSRPILKPKPNE